jgi:hypothetical protein
MSEAQKPSLGEIEAFARRFGLDKLSSEHLARMAELAVHVGDLGRTLPRPRQKEDSPAPTFRCWDEQVAGGRVR